jgi:hypothetical protein
MNLTEGKWPFREAGGRRPSRSPLRHPLESRQNIFRAPLNYDLQMEEGLVRKGDSGEQVNEYYIGLN